MDRCDLNGNGYLEFNEFVAAAIDHSGLLNKENIQSLFKMMDVDGDGNVTAKELQNLFTTNKNIAHHGTSE